jgi:hypothetical protein
MVPELASRFLTIIYVLGQFFFMRNIFYLSIPRVALIVYGVIRILLVESHFAERTGLSDTIETQK